ncbi:MAG TPA: hypothetical protein VK081_00495 [Planctomycetota bacterium]|nr:hypothetical protein [Planctomycetota bacterium]
MRVLLVTAVLLVLGLVGVVVVHEQGKTSRGRSTEAGTTAVVATISTGGKVDIDAHVAPRGLTIVEFTAGF